MIAQRVRHHGRGDDQQEKEIEGFGIKDAGGVNVVHRVGGEIEQRPAATHARASQNAPALPPLKEDACAQKRCAQDHAASHAPAWPEIGHLPRHQQRHANHNADHAQLAEPVGPKDFFKIQNALCGFLGRRFWGTQDANARWRNRQARAAWRSSAGRWAVAPRARQVQQASMVP